MQNIYNRLKSYIGRLNITISLEALKLKYSNDSANKAQYKRYTMFVRLRNRLITKCIELLSKMHTDIKNTN
ncbi:hypothetical protein ABIB62_003018 [Mucilaginibacter sp. UYP25]